MSQDSHQWTMSLIRRQSDFQLKPISNESNGARFIDCNHFTGKNLIFKRHWKSSNHRSGLRRRSNSGTTGFNEGPRRTSYITQGNITYRVDIRPVSFVGNTTSCSQPSSPNASTRLGNIDFKGKHQI